MHILCAPDSFKESISAQDAAAAMARGIHRANPQATWDLCPIADGGEGTVEALVAATGGSFHTSVVSGPLGAPVRARWGLLGLSAPDESLTAVLEMAEAAGLHRVAPADRRPLKATTFGVGELIAAALEHGARRLLLGIGGSATTDGGVGAAQALGVRFFDTGGNLLTAPLGGRDLTRIARVDLSARNPRLAEAELFLACDVQNPLTGPNGAARIYGPQKGAGPDKVARLEAGLEHLAQVVRRTADLRPEETAGPFEKMPGSGAAGGLGFGGRVLLGGYLKRGIELVLSATDFARRVSRADLCLTGEGRIDGQTLSGKALWGVTQAAAQAGVPVVALVGSTGTGAEKLLDCGLQAYHCIGPDLPPQVSMSRAGELIEEAAYQAVLTFLRRGSQASSQG